MFKCRKALATHTDTDRASSISTAAAHSTDHLHSSHIITPNALHVTHSIITPQCKSNPQLTPPRVNSVPHGEGKYEMDSRNPLLMNQTIHINTHKPRDIVLGDNNVLECVHM